MNKDNWGDNPVKRVNLTKGQFSKLQNRVIASGKDRLKTQGKINEIDFLAGAMTTMHILGVACPVWVIQLMTGTKIITKD